MAKHVSQQYKPKCYLCLATDGNHTEACKATPFNAVPLGEGKSWRAGVRAARKATRKRPNFAQHYPQRPMLRCETCKHWTPMGLIDPGTFGSCAVSTSCVDGSMQAVSLRPQAAWEDESAELRTRRDFGCVKWEVKR